MYVIYRLLYIICYFKDVDMPPKTKFTKNQILDAAFDIANSEGFDSITIRKVADSLGSSIAPIYVNFKNIDELKYGLAKKITALTTEIMLSVKTHDPFLDIGAGNIKLAMDYTQLYRDFHMNPNCIRYFTRNHEHQNKLIEKMASSEKLQGFSKDEMKEILQVMAYLTYGIIFEYLQGENKKTYDAIINYMEKIADDLIAGFKIRKGVK